MNASSTPLREARVAARLRAAGCVYAEDEARLLCAEARAGELEAMVQARVAGQPLELVLGWAEFCGLHIDLCLGVFIPRRRSEFLARRAIQLARPHDVVLDLCCGAGALGAAVAAAVPRITLLAADIDAVAVACARRNLARWGGRVFHGDLYEPLPAALRGRVNVLVANAPYVSSSGMATLPREARLHEPASTLHGGADGHAVQRGVADAAARWLAPAGHLLIETGPAQAQHTALLLRRGGLVPRIERCEEFDATVVIATHPPR